MKIYGSHLDQIRPERPNNAPVQRSGDGSPPPVAPVAPASRQGDSVEFSSKGRSLAGGLQAELDPDRVAELRRKVYQGAYNSLDIVDQVARRILTRGDY